MHSYFHVYSKNYSSLSNNYVLSFFLLTNINHQGICFFHLGEFDRALTSLGVALKIVDRSMGDSNRCVPNNPIKAIEIDQSNVLNCDSTGKRNEQNLNETAPPVHLNSDTKSENNNYKMAEREKILSYISKTMKNLEVQKTNVSNQRNAMRKAFASPNGLGEKRSRTSADRKCVELKFPAAITGPPSKYYVDLKGVILNVVSVLYRLVVTLFFGSKRNKK